MSWNRQKKHFLPEDVRIARRQAAKRWRDKHPEAVTRQLQVQQQNRELLNTLKERPCTDCGVRYPTYVMDWDHVRGAKSANVSDMRKRNNAIPAILAEIAKCDLVCANCHRIRTYIRSTIKNARAS